MTDATIAETCVQLVKHGVGYKQTDDFCGKPATFVTKYGNGFCKRHANTKAGRVGQRTGFLVAK